MNFAETIEYLYNAMPSFQSVGAGAYKPGLERIRGFCEALGSPHVAYRTIHVAGTNGKGSTSHALAAVLQSAGYRVGLFTSPHLKSFRERMRVDGEMISETEVVDFVARHRAQIEEFGLSFFEMTAAMAFDFFARRSVDIAVIETGLGGRLDATNIVEPLLSVITNIAIDHTQYLGTTLPEIAAEKAGIIKAKREVIVGVRDEAYHDVFVHRAAEMESRLVVASDRFEVVEVSEFADYQRVTLAVDGRSVSYDLDLLGEYQRRNIVTVLAAVEALNRCGLEVSDEALRVGLRGVMELTGLMGRWQILGREPLVVCDTGHNPHGLREVVRQIERQGYRRLYCVLGFANDKRLEEILPLFPSSAHYIFTQANIERAYDAEAVADVARAMGLSCEVVGSVVAAVERARALAGAEDMIYIGGSTFVVAEI